MSHMVGASYGLIWLGEPDWTGELLGDASSEMLLTPVKGGVYIHTAIHTGLVEVDARFWSDAEAAPPSEKLASTDVEEASARFVDTSGEACILPLGGEGEVITGLTGRPGIYEVRCTAFGRQTGASKLDRATERYVVDIWPVSSL